MIFLPSLRGPKARGNPWGGHHSACMRCKGRNWIAAPCGARNDGFLGSGHNDRQPFASAREGAQENSNLTPIYGIDSGV